ncbi:hypothetical protein M5689_000092 [Euphorbia peplus]|nr:hypothetical protein M5689_000091 [Euphorbia peplus]WCJ17693.1 hypothetical protein M5689_000092 [Euphorbia peplus]
MLGYRGVRHPSWLSLLTNLVSIQLVSCFSIQWLPPLDQLPSLKKLSIRWLTNLERIDVAVNFENGASSSFFPSLIDLTLQGCPNLKGFVRCDTGVAGTNPSSVSMEELPCFPRLSKLQVRSCPNLIYMPLFPELKKMTLYGDDDIKWLIQVLKTTTDNDDLMLWQNLKVLRSVSFHHMQNLVSLPKGLQYLNALQRLSIVRCPQLSERCKNNTAEDWPNISHIPNIEVDYKSIQRNGCYLL